MLVVPLTMLALGSCGGRMPCIPPVGVLMYSSRGYKMWNATPSASAAARRPGPTSLRDTAMACRAGGQLRAPRPWLRKVLPFGPVASLEERHWPGHVSEAQDFDRGRQLDQLCSKARLQVLGETGDGTRQLADHVRVGEGRAQSEEPQARGRHAIRREPVEGLLLDRRQGCRGTRWSSTIVAGTRWWRDRDRRGRRHEPDVLGRQSRAEEFRSPARWKQDNGATEIDDGDTPAVIEAPPVAHRGWD